MFKIRRIWIFGTSSIMLPIILLTFVSNIYGSSDSPSLFNGTLTAVQGTYDANIQASIEAIIGGTATLSIDEAVEATLTALAPVNTPVPTIRPSFLTATVEASIIQTYMYESWGPGFGEVINNVGFSEFGIQDITIDFSRIGNRVASGTMRWTARFPSPGLDGVGTRRDAVQIRGRYFTSITELRDISLWNFIDGWDDEDIVLWLRWQRTIALEGDPRMTNVALAVVTEDGQMRGAVYDPARDNALIFVFTIWPDD